MARNHKDHQKDPQAGMQAGLVLDANVNPTLLCLQCDLKQAEQRLEQARTRLEATEPAFQQAQEAFKVAESRHLAGRISDAELAQARVALEQARKAQAIAAAEVADAEHLTSILPQAVTEAKQAAMTEVRDNLRKAYAAKLTKLAALVREAKQVSDEVDALHYQAVTQFHGGMMQVGHGLIAATDLGEAGGYVGQAAGMLNLASPWLTNTRAGRNQPSMADLWLKEVEQYLAVTPEARAAQDVEHRVHTLARVKQEERDAVVNERAREELRRRIAERYAIPLSEVFV